MEKDNHTENGAEKDKTILILLVSPDGTHFDPDFYSSHKIEFPDNQNTLITDCRNREEEDRFILRFLYHCMEFEDGIGQPDNELFFAIMEMVKISKKMRTKKDKSITRPTLTALLEINPNMPKYYCHYLKRLNGKPAGIYIHNDKTDMDVAYIDSSRLVIE